MCAPNISESCGRKGMRNEDSEEGGCEGSDHRGPTPNAPGSSGSIAPESPHGARIRSARGDRGATNRWQVEIQTPRPEPWLPYVFTSPKEAADAGMCNLL